MARGEVSKNSSALAEQCEVPAFWFRKVGLRYIYRGVKWAHEGNNSVCSTLQERTEAHQWKCRKVPWISIEVY